MSLNHIKIFFIILYVLNSVFSPYDNQRVLQPYEKEKLFYVYREKNVKREKNEIHKVNGHNHCGSNGIQWV